MFRIDSGIPAPEARRGRKPLYPWASMKPGDSFLVPANGDEERVRHSLISGGNKWCRRNAPNLRCVTKAEEDGVRVWLTKR